MALDPLVTGLVLLAALLHASWNAVTKSSDDPLLTLAVVMGVGSVGGALAVGFVDVPGPRTWAWLGASVFFHGLYHLFLLQAYRLGDLSQVYPIARGAAPLGVAVLAGFGAGEWLSPGQTAGLLLASGGIASLALIGGAWRGAHGRALAAAACTAAMIGTYSFIDGQGVRSAAHPQDFIAWQFLFSGTPLVLVALWLRRGRVAPFLRARGARAAGAGLIALVGYAIVLWAMSRGAMAIVAALRESSVLIAALLGTSLLGEPFGPRRVAAAALVAIGLVLMQTL